MLMLECSDIQGVDLPSWLSVSETGLLTGTPINDDVGSHTVTVEVVDAAGVNQSTFSITVNNTNDAPVFDFTPPLKLTKTLRLSIS